MDEIKLLTFITVCECGSFTKAAEQLFLSPIAVKKQVDALEKDLGEKIFLRKATGVELTVQGEVFLKHARIILAQIEKAKLDVEKTSIALKGEIIAGYSIHFSYKFLGALSTGFSEVKENHIIQFQKYPAEDLTDLLLKRQVHCVFAEKTLMKDPEKQGIDFHPLVSFPVFAIMKKGHPLSERTLLSVSDLIDQELYVSSILGNDTLKTFEQISSEPVQLIEKTDRNILFNRIIKGAIEIYPKQFSYYESIPMELDPVIIGIFTLKTQPQIIRNMVQYARNHVSKHSYNLDDIL